MALRASSRPHHAIFFGGRKLAPGSLLNAFLDARARSGKTMDSRDLARKHRIEDGAFGLNDVPLDPINKVRRAN